MSNLLLDFDLALDNLITSQALEVLGLGATEENGGGEVGGGGGGGRLEPLQDVPQRKPLSCTILFLLPPNI